MTSTVVPIWTLADRLRKIRREYVRAGQIPFANDLEVTPQAYSAWESGRTRPRDIVALARRIELVTGVPAWWTLGLQEEPAAATQSSLAAVSITQRANAEKSSFCTKPGQHDQGHCGCPGTVTDPGHPIAWRPAA